MRHRQFLAFGSVQIVFPVGVQRGKDLSLKSEDLVHHLSHNVMGLGCAQRTVHIILLHIHHNQKMLHGFSSFQFSDGPILTQNRKMVKADISFYDHAHNK